MNYTIAHTPLPRVCLSFESVTSIFSDHPDIPRPWEKEEGDEYE